MKTIKFKDEEYRCPTSWSEITLKQQMKVTKDSELFKTEASKRIALISGYLGIDAELMRRTDLKEIMPLFKHLKFLKDPIPDKLVTEFEFKGEKYYVAQNLIKQEFQDFVSLENIMNNTSGNIYDALPFIIAVLAKRKKDNDFESLDDYDVEERAKLFEDLPISIANGIGVFFSSSEKVSTTISLLYSNPEKLIQAKADEVLNTLNKQGGQGWLTRCQIGIFKNLLKYIKRNANKYFTSTALKS